MRYSFFSLFLLSSSCCMAMDPSPQIEDTMSLIPQILNSNQGIANVDIECDPGSVLAILEKIGDNPVEFDVDRETAFALMPQLREKNPQAYIGIEYADEPGMYNVTFDPERTSTPALYIKGLDSLLKKNLKINSTTGAFIKDAQGHYTFKDFKEKNNNFTRMLLPYVDIFPYRSELKVICADYIFSQKKYGLDEQSFLFAHGMMSDAVRMEFCLFNRSDECFGGDQLLDSYLWTYAERLSSFPPLTNPMCNLKVFWMSMDKRDFTDYARRKSISVERGNLENFKNQLRNAYAEDCKSVLKEIEINKHLFHDYHKIFDAIFFPAAQNPYIQKYYPGFLNVLSKALYREIDCPSSVKLAYAEYVLIPQKKKTSYEKAISLYKQVLGTEKDYYNFFQTPENHANLGLCLLMSGNYEEACKEYKKSLAWKELHSNRWNLAVTQFLQDNSNSEALKNMKNLLEQDKKIYGFNLSKAKAEYKYFLLKAGKTEELAQLLKKAREQKKTKEVALTQAMKEVIVLDQQKKREQSQALAKPRQSNNNKPKKVLENSPPSYKEEVYLVSHQEEKYIPQIKEEKKKTRPVISPMDDLQAASSQPCPQQPTVESWLMSIDDLTESAPARKFFNDLLFATYKEDENAPISFNDQVKISSSALIDFYTAIDQPINKKQGKGSHTVAKLTFDDEEKYGNARENQMVPFPKQNKMDPLYIKKVRQSFIDAGIIPQRLHNHPDFKGLNGSKK